MIVAFRADASPRIGGGHVARCLALAEALKQRGADVHFIVRGELDLARSGVTAHALAAQEPDDAGTRRILEGLPERPRWLVVDHYGLAAPWESAVSDLVDRIFVLDDLADRPHDCDLLLDQSALGTERYAALVPERCQVLYGLEHALLRSEYAEARATLVEHPPGIRSILASLGAADPDNVTRQVIEGYQRISAAPPLVVVAGRQNPHIAILEAVCAEDSRISLRIGVERMWELLVECDLAIGALGVSTWERCCLGVPSLLVGLTPAQDEIAADLARRGLVRYLGPSPALGPAAYERAITEALADPSAVRAMAARGMATIDGRGAERVVAIMLAS